MLHAQIRILGIFDTNRSPHPSEEIIPSAHKQTKKNFRFVDFDVPANHRVKIKEIRKGDFGLTR